MNKIAQLQALLKDDPQDTFLRYALALEHVKLNELAQAVNIFDSLVETEPQYLATYLQYGNLLAQMGQIEKAEGVFRKGIEIAKIQSKFKAQQELEQALFLLD